MPLTWDITACAESPETLWAEDRRAVTEVLIFQSMAIGIGSWTEANIAEVYARVKVVESIYGALVIGTKDGVRQDILLTPADVRALIGLRTNVGPLETRASFIRRHITSRGGWVDGFVRDFTRAAEKASDAA